MRLLVISALFVALAVSPAAADAIEPPPDDCPRGAQGSSSHDGVWCTPSICGSDADCAGWGATERDPMVCRATGLCVATETRVPAGRLPSDVPRTPYQVGIARGACERDSDCAGGATCVIVPRCVRPSMAETIRARTGCSCGVVPGRGGTPLAALLLAALLVAVALRRRQLASGAGPRPSSARA